MRQFRFNLPSSNWDNLPSSNWEFTPLKLRDKARYDDYISISAFPVDIWSSNFAYLWAHTRVPKKLDIMSSEIDGMLVTWILNKKGRLFLPCLPVGAGSLNQVVAVVSKCAEYCFQWNSKSGFEHKPVLAKLSSNQLKYLRQSKEFDLVFLPRLLTGIERHLSISQLTTLEGKEFSNIRYKLNKFKRDCPEASLRLYEPGDLEDIIRLEKLWKKSVATKHRRIRDGFYFRPTIRHSQALGLEILVVELKGKIIGMTTGGLLPTGQSWGYITKFDNRYNGLSEYLVIAMVRRIREISPQTELLNIGTDFGNRNLAVAKEKFRPVKAYQRYSLSWRS